MLRIERKFKYFLLNFLSKFFSSRKIPPDRIELKQIKKVLVIGQDRFGDCILSTPAVKALKTLIPHANIIYLAHGKYSDIILNNPNLNEILVFDKKERKKNLLKFILNLRRKKIDLSIVLCTHPIKLTNAFLSYISGAKIRVGYKSTYIKTDEIDESGMNKLFFNLYLDELDSSRHEVEWNLKLIELLGFKETDFDKRPQIYLTEQEKAKAKNIINNLRKLKCSKLIGIHPLIPDGLKWRLNDYVELIDMIYKNETGEVLLFWDTNESKNIEFIMKEVKNKPLVSCETKTIRDLAALISKLNLFVGKDTASSHIASVFSIPSIVLFTSGVNVNQWRPWGNNNKLFTNESKFNVDDVFFAIKDFLGICSK